MALAGKTIVLIVSGGIAAYKAADLASRLIRAGANVRVAMTGAARRFVAPLTFEAITGHPVYSDVFETDQAYRMEHIEWARWADALLIAPATADLMARMAHGLADDPATTLYLAFDGPVWLAPAMNTVMWNHPATQANARTLSDRGVHLLGPASGSLACGEFGAGRLEEPESIVKLLEEQIGAKPKGSDANGAKTDAASSLAGSKVLITSGPTREALDPIRYISNRSTGRMGAALAEAAARLGAEVVLIHGPMAVPCPSGVTAVAAPDAKSMLEAVQTHLPDCRFAIFAAAVANYTAAEAEPSKIKGGERLTLELVRTTDIAAWAGAHNPNGRCFLVGFAAESENLIAAAKKKLEAKRLDMICANPIGVPGVGFEATDNSVTLLDREGAAAESGTMSKPQLAEWIWAEVMERAAAGSGTP